MAAMMEEYKEINVVVFHGGFLMMIKDGINGAGAIRWFRQNFRRQGKHMFSS
ncbi:hypothetical protein HanIR_Chr05g0219281 [Helianthus annuus]|nr:hypothetical protein HanIR_Chr05g0219281 [Helianthus annuus]